MVWYTDILLPEILIVRWSVKAPEYYKKDAELYHQRFVILIKSGLVQRHIPHRNLMFRWSVKAPEYYKKDAELYHPRMKSRETMFAEALILGPRHP